MTKKSEIELIEEEYGVHKGRQKVKMGKTEQQKPKKTFKITTKNKSSPVEEGCEFHPENLKPEVKTRIKSKVFDRSKRLLGLIGVIKLISFRPFNRRIFSVLRPHLYQLSFKEVDYFYNSYRHGLPRKFYYDDSYAISYIRSYNLRSLGK